MSYSTRPAACPSSSLFPPADDHEDIDEFVCVANNSCDCKSKMDAEKPHMVIGVDLGMTCKWTVCEGEFAGGTIWAASLFLDLAPCPSLGSRGGRAHFEHSSPL